MFSTAHAVANRAGDSAGVKVNLLPLTLAYAIALAEARSCLAAPPVARVASNVAIWCLAASWLWSGGNRHCAG